MTGEEPQSRAQDRLGDGHALGQAVATSSRARISPSDATVIIATYHMKRWPLLVKAVSSLQKDPSQPRDIIICVDGNEELLDRVRATWPGLTTIANVHSQGASGARNTAAALVKTPFIVFVDDDIQVGERWLERLLEPFSDPTVVGTGGGVAPRWQTRRPRWFPDEFGWVVGASYRGMPTTQCVVRNVWAENMAVRTEVFRAAGGFRAGFGKVGDRNSPEDTDLCIRMAETAADAKWCYVPEAQVEHHVPTSRATFSYFLLRSYLEGRGKVQMAGLIGKQEKLQSERDYLRQTLPTGVAASLWGSLRYGDMGGFLRAGAIVAGALAAGVGAFSALCGLVLSRTR